MVVAVLNNLGQNISITREGDLLFSVFVFNKNNGNKILWRRLLE